MDSGVNLNRENVAKVVDPTGATAILVTRLVSHEITGEQVDERTEIKTRRKTDTPLNFFRYDFDEYDEAAYLVIKSTVQLTTDMFETGKD